MKKSFKLLAAATLLLSLGATAANAQTKEFRDPGYKGSIYVGGSFVPGDKVTFFPSVGISQGYMFGDQFYIGAGLQYDFLKKAQTSAFADFQYFTSDSPNSVVLGLKAGATGAWSKDKRASDPADAKGKLHIEKAWFFATPSVGYSWTLDNGCGLTTSLGAALNFKNKDFNLTPQLTVAFEF